MKMALSLYSAIILLVAQLSFAQEVTDPFKRGDLNPVDRPGLPRVLIIGDSISMGYTLPVRLALRDKANVHRVQGNCQDSGYSLGKIKEWLGTNQWDVIHFNWGIWDTHGYDKTTGQWIQLQDEGKFVPEEILCRNSLDQYRTNLTKLVAILKGTHAKLIWASTTPIMARKDARFEQIPQYNEAAAVIMQENSIPVDDLFSLSLPYADKWQQADRCHFQPIGSEELARQVAKNILDALDGVKSHAP